MRRILLLALIILAASLFIGTAHANASFLMTAEKPTNCSGQLCAVFVVTDTNSPPSWKATYSVNAYSGGSWHIVSGSQVQTYYGSGTEEVIASIQVAGGWVCVANRPYRTSATLVGGNHDFSGGTYLC